MTSPAGLFQRSDMARRLMVVLALAFSAAPVAAQPAKPVEGALARWVETFNRGAPTAAYFSRDAVLVRGNGTFRGAAVIDEMEQRESKAGLRLSLQVDDVQVIGTDAATAVGRYTVTLPGPTGQTVPGVSLHILERMGNEWLVRAASFTRVQAAPPTTAAGLPSARN